MFAQSEHGIDSLCGVVTPSKKLARNLIKLIKEKLPNIERKDVVSESLLKNGFIVHCKNYIPRYLFKLIGTRITQ